MSVFSESPGEILRNLFPENVAEVLAWAYAHWVTIVLTGEIIGAVVAVKMGNYRRGLGWLGAGLLTIWLGAY